MPKSRPSRNSKINPPAPAPTVAVEDIIDVDDDVVVMRTDPPRLPSTSTSTSTPAPVPAPALALVNSDGASDSGFTVAESTGTSFESLLLDLVQDSSVREQLLSAHLKSKPARKNISTDKTPEGLTNIRACFMSMFGLIKPLIDSDILELFYSAVGGKISDGPMKIATPVLLAFSRDDVLSAFWKSVSAEYSRRGIKRGEAKPFCAEHLIPFLASLVITFGKGSDLTLNGNSLDMLSNSSLPELLALFKDFKVQPTVKQPCAAETKLKQPCKRTGVVSHNGKFYCKQHGKIVA